MQDRVPTEFVPGQARTIIESELKVPLEEVFSEFDDEPMNAASIGQVHAAKLKDGTDVCVKIQYPGIERKFRSDISTIIRFCRFAMPEHVDAMREIERKFDEEFDYEQEARSMQEIHDNLERAGWMNQVAVPVAYKEFTSRQVLTMSRLHGVPLISAIKKQMSNIAKQQNTTVEKLEEEHKRVSICLPFYLLLL